MPDQPSHEGTVAITARLAPEVRKRLKVLAARQQRTMNELIAEAQGSAKGIRLVIHRFQ